MKKAHLIASIVLAIFTTGLLAAQCDPDCKGHVAGDKVPDPTNCTCYYMCLADGSPTDHSIPCPSGQHFDDTVGDCAAGGAEACGPPCVPTECKVTCEAPMELISDPMNCGFYYECDAALKPVGPKPCPSDKPYFNGKNCVNDESQCCEVSCDAFCYPGNVQIIDPRNCTNYYICVEENVPASEMYHYHCPPNENFDMTSSRCEAGAPCVVLCPEGSAGTPATPTTPPTTTTTTITSSSTPSSTTPSSDCVTSLVCPSAGNFPMCQSCQPGYFHCVSGGQNGALTSCSNGYVFNPVPGFPYCILPTNCPYYPYF